MIDDGIDGESGRTMDLQFPGDIPPVCDDGIGGNAQMVGNLLVGHSLHQTDDDILLTVAEGIGIVGILIDHARDLGRDIVLPCLSLHPFDGRDENRLLDLGMQC